MKQVIVSGYAAETKHEYLREVANVFIPNGFLFYVFGLTIEDEPSEVTDHQVLKRFEAAKRRSGGADVAAHVRYLRWNRYWVVTGTEKVLWFFAVKGRSVGDFREDPLIFAGYKIRAVRSKDGKGYEGCVEVGGGLFEGFAERWLKAAVSSSAYEIATSILEADFGDYPQVVERLERVLRAINERRKAAGLDLVPRSAVGLGNSSS